MQILERLNLVVAEESEAEELRVSKPYGSVAQPMAVGAVRKPRPAQGQRQVQGGVEPVQQPGVPGRQHPRRLLKVGLADTIRVSLPSCRRHLRTRRQARSRSSRSRFRRRERDRVAWRLRFQSDRRCDLLRFIAARRTMSEPRVPTATRPALVNGCPFDGACRASAAPGVAIIPTAGPQFCDAWLLMTKTYTLTTMRRRDRNRTLDGKPVDCGRQPSKEK